MLGVHASRKASGDDVRTLRRADKERKHISLILIAMRESRVMRADDELLFDLAKISPPDEVEILGFCKYWLKTLLGE